MRIEAVLLHQMKGGTDSPTAFTSRLITEVEQKSPTQLGTEAISIV